MYCFSASRDFDLTFKMPEHLKVLPSTFLQYNPRRTLTQDFLEYTKNGTLKILVPQNKIKKMRSSQKTRVLGIVNKPTAAKPLEFWSLTAISSSPCGSRNPPSYIYPVNTSVLLETQAERLRSWEPNWQPRRKFQDENALTSSLKPILLKCMKESCVYASKHFQTTGSF